MAEKHFDDPQKSIPLQPLRIPCGWLVSHNEFYEVDPPLHENRASDKWLLFPEDIFQASNASFKVIVDLGWLPEFQRKGRFRLVIVKLTVPSRQPNAWAKPIFEFRTRSRRKIVKMIEEVLDHKFLQSFLKPY